METDRRSFLKKSLAAAGVVSLPEGIKGPCFESFFGPSMDAFPDSSADVSEDENYWWYIKNCYTSSPNILNLNNAVGA